MRVHECMHGVTCENTFLPHQAEINTYCTCIQIKGRGQMNESPITLSNKLRKHDS